jgi:hypothetical protein
MAMATIETRQPGSLPRAIRRGLGRLRLRVRAVGAMRGLGQGTTCLAVGAAVAMAADVAFALPVQARWAIWLAGIVMAAVALIGGVVRPLVRRLSWNELAALAERGEPALSERLTSAVALLRQRPHGSPELIAAVVNDAAEHAGKLDLTRAVSTRGAIGWLMVASVVSALVVLPSVVKPDPFARLGQRLLFPWAAIDRVSRFVVEIAPGDQVVALGSDVRISATVRSRFGEVVPSGEAWLEWTGSDGATHREKMVADAETTTGKRTFAVTLPRLSGSLGYRALVGNDASRRHQINAIELPAVVSLKAHVEPPAYTRRSAAQARDPAHIDAWEDSRVTLEIEANRPLERAELAWPAMIGQAAKASDAAPSHVVKFDGRDDRKRWSASVVAGASGPFAIKLRDEYGLENKRDPGLSVVVRPDMPPTLAIVAPDEFKETSPYDYLTLAVAARDDVAVASAELHYTIERSDGSAGPTSGSVAAPLVGLGTPSARGEAALSLGTLALKPGDALSYRVRATDNRPAPRGPNIVWSSTHLLRIIEHSDSLQSRLETADREALRARLEGIQKAVAANRQKADQLKFRADEVRRGHGNWDETKAKDLADREASAHEVVDQLQLLSRDLEDHPTFQPLARPARQIAEVESEAARAALDAARRATDPAARHTELDQAGTRLAAVTWKVDELKRKFDELARLDDDRRRLAELSQREDDLANRTDRAGDHADFEGLADEQERLRRDLDEVLKNSASLRGETLAAQAREAEALAARARNLAEQQREAARRTADQEPRNAALKALAGKQRALEDDARRLAVRLDERLAQNSRGRVDVDALARAGDAIERGDFDQARDRSHEAENALERLTRDVEDVRNNPKALARRLAHRQELLKNDTAEAVRESREHPPQTPEGKAALAGRLKPLIERQEAIARLAAAIPAPKGQMDAARDAAQKTATARDDLRAARPREVEGHQNEARDALSRLADALPDANQRRDQARQKLGEARSRYEEIARDLENHLRETAPKPGQPHDPIRSAAELARRVAPLAGREREVARALGAIDPEPRAISQRDRAARRAVEFADALETLRQQAPAVAPNESKPDEPRPLAAWRLLGSFPIDSASPFPTDRPVDLSAKYNDRKGQPTAWKPSAPVDGQSTIDLGQLYGRDDRLAAFACTEIPSPTARSARMLIGSDDTLTVWLNGKTVYDFRSSRSYTAAADRVDVSLDKGVNQIVVKCGNLNGEWKFSLAVTPPPEVYRPITNWRVVGPFAIGDKPPFAIDGPVDMSKKHNNRKGQAATWQAVKPVNDKGAIDLASHYSTRDNGVAALGYAEVNSPRARHARLLIGSNDTFTVWLNGKQVYDSQIGRSWAPDHARIDVPLNGGPNRILVKCGNTGGNWMYSVALSEDVEHRRESDPKEIAHAEPDFEQLRAAIPALQVATRSALDRLQQKLDGKTPAEELAAALAADERDLKSAEEKAPPDDAAARGELAADQRRIANALANLEAPDAPLAQAEAIDRAIEAARALEAPAKGEKPAQAREAMTRAANAAAALATRLRDEQSPKEQIRELARVERTLVAPLAHDNPSALARQQHAIANDLARLPVDNKGEAARAVAAAALLSDQAASLDAGPQPDSATAGKARDRAAQALERLAAATEQVANAPGRDAPASGHEAPAPDDPALGVTPADRTDAAALARRQRHIREELQEILGEASASQRALRERSTALGREAADLRDRAQQISPGSQWTARAAAELLGRSVPSAMDRAATGLHQGRPGDALRAQREAADQAEQAARLAEDMAGALRADRPPGAVDRTTEGFAAAQSAARAAGQHLARARAVGQSPTEASRAAEAAAAAMHKAAQGLRATRRGARGPSKIRQPATTANDAQTTLADHGDPDLAGLKAAVRARSGRTWGELPGHLRTEILQMSQGRYRDDYARLIELYFREIAVDQGARP